MRTLTDEDVRAVVNGVMAQLRLAQGGEVKPEVARSPEVMTVAAFARAAGLAADTVRRWVRCGRLKAFPWGGRELRVLRSELDKVGVLCAADGVGGLAMNGESKTGNGGVL